jgi:hypothetical protein
MVVGAWSAPLAPPARDGGVGRRPGREEAGILRWPRDPPRRSVRQEESQTETVFGPLARRLKRAGYNAAARNGGVSGGSEDRSAAAAGRPARREYIRMLSKMSTGAYTQGPLDIPLTRFFPIPIHLSQKDSAPSSRPGGEKLRAGNPFFPHITHSPAGGHSVSCSKYSVVRRGTGPSPRLPIRSVSRWASTCAGS